MGPDEMFRRAELLFSHVTDMPEGKMHQMNFLMDIITTVETHLEASGHPMAIMEEILRVCEKAITEAITNGSNESH